MLAVTGAIIFLITIILSVLMFFGVPLGDLTMGGQYKVLPPMIRVLMIPQMLLQWFGLKSILRAGGIIPLKHTYKVTKNIGWIFTVYFIINSIGNFFSKSKKERCISGSLSVFMVICFAVTTILMKKQLNTLKTLKKSL